MLAGARASSVASSLRLRLALQAQLKLHYHQNATKMAPTSMRRLVNLRVPLVAESRRTKVPFIAIRWCPVNVSFSTATAGAGAEPLIRVRNLPAPGTGHIRILELNRPSARNAISRALLSSLSDEIKAVQGQYDEKTGSEVASPLYESEAEAKDANRIGPTRALIVASADDASFCAGADLKERRTFSPDQTHDFLADLRSTLANLAALPVPTISAISSVALGGGLELALATHMRVMSAKAVVGLPETRLGIIPGAGGTWRLPAIIGVPRARHMILTGAQLTGAEAHFLGLADVLVEMAPEDDKLSEEAKVKTARAHGRELVLKEAVQLATSICRGAPVAVRAALTAVTKPGEKVEEEMYDRVMGTDDRLEALRAFAEKRIPVFKGF